MKIKLRELRKGFAPNYQHIGDAGADLKANLGKGKEIYIPAKTRKLIPAGFIVELPMGKEMQIRPRSGLALKYGITVLNSPGTIDSKFRGEVGVIIYNSGTEPYVIKDEDRFAQAVIADYTIVDWELVNALDMTEDRDGGFGHSGI